MLINLLAGIGFLTSALVVTYLASVAFAIVGDFYVELCSAKARSLNCSGAKINSLSDRVAHLEEQLTLKK